MDLALRYNDIEVIVEGTFEYNLNLKRIELQNNKIAKIFPKVFDHLNMLMHLDIRSNICINMNAVDSASAIQELIKQVKIQCPSPETTTDVGEYSQQLESCSSELSVLREGVDSLRESTNERFRIIEEGKTVCTRNTQNSTLLDFGERVQDAEEKIDGINKQMEDMKLNVKEVHVKIIKSIDLKVGQLERKVNDKIKNVEEKMDKILKALNIQD